MDVNASVKSLSEKTGLPEAELRNRMKESGLPDEQAIVKIKSNPFIRRMMRGLTFEGPIRVLSIEQPRNRKRPDSDEEYMEAGFICFLDAMGNGELAPWRVRLYNERAAVVDTMEAGALYQAKVKLFKAPQAMLFPGVELVDSKAAFPEVKEILAKTPKVALEDIGKYLHTIQFFEGLVGDVSKTGTIVTIATADSEPVTVWLSEPTQKRVGELVTAFGIVSEGSNGFAINAGGVF
jgi:hypothetical protein